MAKNRVRFESSSSAESPPKRLRPRTPDKPPPRASYERDFLDNPVPSYSGSSGSRDSLLSLLDESADNNVDSSPRSSSRHSSNEPHEHETGANTANVQGGRKKPPRKSGYPKWVQEVMKMRSTTHNLIPKMPFQR